MTEPENAPAIVTPESDAPAAITPEAAAPAAITPGSAVPELQLPRLERQSITGEILALILFLVVIGGLCAGYAWIRHGRIQDTAGLDAAKAAEIVGRGSTMIGLDQAAPVWSARLAGGEVNLADYLMRLFVSPGYLNRNPDDPHFLSDANWVLTGESPGESGLAEAEALLTKTGSRLAYLNDLLAKLGFAARLRLPESFTRLRTLTLANDRPPAGSEIIGLLPITTEIRLTGSDALFKLYIDGYIRIIQPVRSDEPSMLNASTIEWDTRQEQPGRHSLDLLILSSDGRGKWLDLSEYSVPAVTPLQSGQILAVRQDTGGTSWYLLPAKDEQAFLTIIGADRPLDLQMVDLHGKELARTGGIAGRLAALRSRTAEDSCYVRIDSPGSQPAQYTLAASLAAAIPLNEPNRLLGVLERNGQKILVQDENGRQSWQELDLFSLQDPTARLSLLELKLPDGSMARIAQSFDPAVSLYGLYVVPETSELKLAARTMEGNAAQLQIAVLTGQGEPQILAAGQPVPLARSANRLQLTVTGFDSSQQIYEVNILRPPHDQGYDQTLDLFPLSYRTSLWLLHVQHPSWQMQATPAGVSWADFIAAQDVKGISLVSSLTYPNWAEPDSPVYDGKYWKAALTQVIAHYADPRNFLNDTDLFQFEQMTYEPSTHSLEGISAIIRDSFMASGNSQNLDYAAILAKAGQTAGISPYFLAAKIIQEMGRKGESALAFGRLAGFEGVYNFYNIGSTPNPDVPNGALINGAKFALYGREPDKKEITDGEKAWLLPWRTPEQAIIGGAIWIALGYVQIGQDTLYYQKFDLVKAGGYYTHQYAQNIQMAWAEARRTRLGYSGLGLLEEPFVFRIPVFADLPDQPAQLPPR